MRQPFLTDGAVLRICIQICTLQKISVRSEDARTAFECLWCGIRDLNLGLYPPRNFREISLKSGGTKKIGVKRWGWIQICTLGRFSESFLKI